MAMKSALRQRFMSEWAARVITVHFIAEEHQGATSAPRTPIRWVNHNGQTMGGSAHITDKWDMEVLHDSRSRKW